MHLLYGKGALGGPFFVREVAAVEKKAGREVKNHLPDKFTQVNSGPRKYQIPFWCLNGGSIALGEISRCIYRDFFEHPRGWVSPIPRPISLFKYWLLHIYFGIMI
ncbi:hypothetical protein DSW25_13755 [Sulfitobacter donghicola DSW-25 = KCTC 12864 = JCM 14565]|uniref:Uncharacterized protein n=1 Tax=Sulfitobacter donghicola DSW-25 = KCTC 12864 = JCM 14565 TaxID=1300350 RepID=A0A073IGE7_9RHOB|nr:hypothetical protein DSW25_13755 [Sulfitobacter donghicola DSW-25 = KCTC 12864 = JCM 14565]